MEKLGDLLPASARETISELSDVSISAACHVSTSIPKVSTYLYSLCSPLILESLPLKVWHLLSSVAPLNRVTAKVDVSIEDAALG